MEIEITTTKKKITKSIINQMRVASITELEKGTAIGYLINIRKNSYKSLLIKYDGDFFCISADYKKKESSIYRKIGIYSQTIKFDSPEICESWWTFYQARLKEASNQIYI
ncbi:MAG: hypothetical protein U9R43_18340 [Thermodesulfobacteriota bacterium]|nr:hypothetical protein [Thermodesulfobacteriota bacterium]